MASPIKPDRSEATFEDYKPAMSEHAAVLEANRCLYCEDAPCTIACPTSNVSHRRRVTGKQPPNLWGDGPIRAG